MSFDQPPKRADCVHLDRFSTKPPACVRGLFGHLHRRSVAAIHVKKDPASRHVVAQWCEPWQNTNSGYLNDVQNQDRLAFPAKMRRGSTRTSSATRRILFDHLSPQNLTDEGFVVS